MVINVRRAKRMDESSIADLADQLGYPCALPEIRARMARIMQDEDQSILVAEQADSKVVGWVHVFIARRLIVETFVEIGGLIVAEGQRGSGVGKVLLEAAEDWARDREVSGMRVRSNFIRKEAHRFYKRLGYRRIKQQNVFYKKFD